MNIDRQYERLLKHVASNIRRLRIKKRLTQEDMANHGFNYRHYQRIESGKHSLNLYSLYRLSKVFGVEVTEFFS